MKNGTIKYIKPAKKSSIKLYILKDFDDSIIDVKNQDFHHEEYYIDGNPCSCDEYLEVMYTRKEPYRCSIRDIKATEKCYEEISPFIFDASFKIVGTAGGKSYDSLKLELIDGQILETFTAWNGDVVHRKFSAEITTANFYKLLLLCDTNPSEFQQIITNEYCCDKWNNLRLKGFKGIWKFELNKYGLAITPYRGTEK